MIEEIVSPDFSDASEKLGVAIPDAPVVLLPRRFDANHDRSDLQYEAETNAVMKVLRAGGVDCQKLDDAGQPIPILQERADLTILPDLLINIAQNPHVVSVALNVLSSYVYEVLRGKRKGAEVKVVLHVGDGDRTRSLEYRGPAEGFGEVLEKAREWERGDS